ncbi:MAG: aminotransferase class IV [Desulfovibrio sp.]|nr:aminotransferase class IV [Desulfovibrio sp.]
MRVLSAEEYIEALLMRPNPGAEKFLAFYNHSLGAVSHDPRLLLIPLDDHLCHRGDGLFESICFRKGRVFALDAHMERMQAGARALRLSPPCPWEEMAKTILDVARSVDRQDGDIRVFLSRGPGGFGISPKECPNAGFYIVVLESNPMREARYAQGVSAFTSSVPPKQPYLARIKNTNYLPNVFMAQEAEERGKDVAVSFDDAGIMGEAAIANIALIDQSGGFVYPNFTNILPGTTLLAAVRIVTEKMQSMQRDISHGDVEAAKEVLLLTSSSLCSPVTEFDGRKVGDGTPGPVAKWLKKRLFDELYSSGAKL